MVRGYLGPHRSCTRCNYHSWTRIEAFKHDKKCTKDKLYTMRLPYRFAAIEKIEDFDKFMCFFCDVDVTFARERAFATHCLTNHSELFQHIGLNKWECYRVANGHFPSDVEPIKYKKKPTNDIESLFESIRTDNDGNNQ